MMQLENENDLHNIVLNAPIGICILDAQTLRAEIVNDSFLAVAGKSRQQIAGQFYWDAFAEARVYYEAAMNGVVSNGEPYYANEVELMLVRHGKEEMVFVTFVYSPVKDRYGKVKKVAIWVLENTLQVVARQKIGEAEEKARIAISSANLGAYDLDYASGELKTDNRFQEIFNYMGITHIDQYLVCLHPDDVKIREQAIVAAKTTGQLDYEARVMLNNGDERWIKLTGRMIFDQERLPLRIIGVCQDVTDSVNFKKKIVESEETLRSMILQAPVAMCMLSGPEHIITVANEAMIQLWGKHAGEVMDKPVFDALPDARGQGLEEVIDGVYQTGETFRANERPVNLLRHGVIETVYQNFIYEAYRGPDQKISGIIAVTTEVSEQVLSRQLLEQSQQVLQQTIADLENSEERARFILNAMPQQVWTADTEGALDYVNDVVSKDFGHTPEDIVGHGWKEFIHPDDLGNCLQSWNHSLKTGQQYVVEFRLRFDDGQYYWHLGRAVPLVEDGHIRLWLGTNTNIAAQKENEAKKDEFLSIASHELKTPLTSIKAFNQLMERVKEPERLSKYLEKSFQQIQRLEKLIADLLDVTKINAGKMVYNMEPFSFKKMMLSSIESIQFTTDTHRIEYGKLAEVQYKGDRFRLEQVMHNFLSNAIKYSPGADRVLVNCFLEQEYIIVSVQDFGIGIARENLSLLFERYYRVDNVEMRFEGLGLGLFISSEILKRHQGTFWIESEEGKGSTFYFSLPIVPDSAPNPIIKTSRYYQDLHLTIRANKADKCLDVDWTGFQTLYTVQNGGLAMLEMLKANGYVKVVNDNTRVLGNWSEASDWAGQVWFPMMEAAGLKHFAWIYSPGGFAQMAAEKSVDMMIGSVVVQFFTEMGAARAWIQDK